MDGERQPQKLEEAKTKFLSGMSKEIQGAMKEVFFGHASRMKAGGSADLGACGQLGIRHKGEVALRGKLFWGGCTLHIGETAARMIP